MLSGVLLPKDSWYVRLVWKSCHVFSLTQNTAIATASPSTNLGEWVSGSERERDDPKKRWLGCPALPGGSAASSWSPAGILSLQPPTVSWHRQLVPAPPSAGGLHHHQLTPAAGDTVRQKCHRPLFVSCSWKKCQPSVAKQHQLKFSAARDQKGPAGFLSRFVSTHCLGWIGSTWSGFSQNIDF